MHADRLVILSLIRILGNARKNGISPKITQKLQSLVDDLLKEDKPHRKRKNKAQSPIK